MSSERYMDQDALQKVMKSFEKLGLRERVALLLYFLRKDYSVETKIKFVEAIRE